MFRSINILLILIIALFIIQCGSDGGTTPEPPTTSEVETWMNSAWTAFEQDNYSKAVDDFSEVLLIEGNNIEALTGRGWSYSFLAEPSNNQMFILALDNFQTATQLDVNNYDAWAGSGMINFALNNYTTALVHLNKVLLAEPNYVFEHKPEISANDLKLAKAQIKFYQGDYDDVVEILDELQPGVVHPIDNPGVLVVQIQELWGNV